MVSKFLTDTVIFSDGVTIDPNGILRGMAKIARVGVQEYIIDGQLKKVLRPVDEVMQSADGFSNQVATLNHPADGVMVNSENAKDLQVGFSGDVSYSDGWLEGLITLTVDEAVNAARTTHKQFSNGYWADLVEESGVWKDELGVQGDVEVEYDYDLIQTNIRGNHIALVIAARAGDKATFQDEGIDTSKCFTIIKDEQILETTMGTIQITDHQDVTITLDDNTNTQRLLSYVDSLKTTVTAKDAELATVNDVVAKQATQIDELTKTNDGLTETVAQLKAEGLQPDFAEATLTERVELWCYYNDSGCDQKLIDHSLPVEGIQKLILSQKIPNFDTKFPDASKDEISLAWKMKDNLIPDMEEEEEVEEDTVNDSIRKKVTDSAKKEGKKVTAAEKAIADAQAAYGDRRTKQTTNNM